MTQNKNRIKHVIYIDANNLYGYAMSKFLPTTNGFIHILKDLTWINLQAIVQKYVFSNLEYSKELQELHNDYPLVQDKIEIKKILSEYQLKIADLYNISIGNVKSAILTKKSVCFIMKTFNFIWD